VTTPRAKVRGFSGLLPKAPSEPCPPGEEHPGAPGSGPFCTEAVHLVSGAGTSSVRRSLHFPRPSCKHLYAPARRRCTAHGKAQGPAPGLFVGAWWGRDDT